MSHLARNIRFLRKQRGEKQEDISVLFQKKANTVGNWENRKSEPSVGEIVRLAEHFGIGLNELLNQDLSKLAAPPTPLDKIPAYIMSGDRSAESAPALSIPKPPGIHYEPSAAPAMSLAESTDSFWVLIRELRTINEKLDSLKNSLAALQAKSADKSQH